MGTANEHDDQPVDAEVVDDGQGNGQHAMVPAAPPPTLAVTPQVNAKELVARLDTIREAMETAMQKDVDYGVIPGTDKPALYKPGAEKLGVLFQLDVQLRNEKTWGPGEHLTVVSHATVFHAPTGARLGFGEGICTTRERKYAKRRAERTCPDCDTAAVIKGKQEYGGGWLCWHKKGGCGAKWRDGDQAIEGQEVGEVENPDLPDLWNTIDKMASKRARIDAVLAVTGASALFTQDVEDRDAPPPDPEAPANGEQRAAEAGAMPSSDPEANGQRRTIDPKWAVELIDKVRAAGLTKVGQLREQMDALGLPATKEGWRGDYILREVIPKLTTSEAERLELQLNEAQAGERS